MKKITFLFAALVAAAGLNAQSVQTSKSTYSVTADFSYTSRYVFRGLEQNTVDAFQPSVEISSGDAYVGVWTSQPITKHANNEIDVYGGYKYKASENLSLEAVGTYYYYPEARNGELHDSYEAGVGSSYNFKEYTASLFAYYDFRLRSDTYQASVGYSYPIKEIGSTLDFNVSYGTVHARNWNGAGTHESYNYFGADVSLPYHLTEKASVVAAIHYGGNKGIVGDIANDRFWYSLGVSVGF